MSPVWDECMDNTGPLRLAPPPPRGKDPQRMSPYPNLISVFHVLGSVLGGTNLKAQLSEAWGQERLLGEGFQQHLLNCGDSGKCRL